MANQGKPSTKSKTPRKPVAVRTVEKSRSSDVKVLAAVVAGLNGMLYRCRDNKTRTFEFASDGCLALTGYTAAQLLSGRGASYCGLIHADDRPRIASEIFAAVQSGTRFTVEYRITARDGTLKWVRERGAAKAAGNARSTLIEGYIEDVTEQRAEIRALQDSERRFRSLFENATEGIFQTSVAGVYLNVNPALATIYGYDSPQDMIAAVADIQSQLYVDPARRGEFIRLMQENGNVTNFISEVRRRGGDRIWISENARAVYDDEGTLLFYEGTVEDVTETKLNQEKLEYLANHDAVTGLPNRLLMNDRLRQMMLQAQRNHSVVAVALIDLDHFKLINDTFGHNQGDQLLQTVARRMQACLRDTDTVARLGGDEFVLLLSGEGRGEAMSQVTQRVLKAIALPWRIEQRELSVSCSIGVSVFPRDGRDVQTLLKNADTAMYKAKELGRNNFQFYSPDMNAAIAERLEMQNALHRAVEAERFVLHYQPKIDLATGRLTGMEALLRINDEMRGLLPPMNFIQIAEETGLIVRIGEWVLREACTFNKLLQQRGLPPLRVAINLSARQLMRNELLRSVEQALRDADLPAEFLELELTESMVMHDPEVVIAMLKQLDALGVQLSIDDFGTGYSSLSYLKRFPVRSLKIDQSFVRELGQDANAAAIVKAIISLGHSLDMQVIAEGVETGEQLAFLMENRCDAMQGFLFSRPLGAEAFIALLEREQARADSHSILDELCPSRLEQGSLEFGADISGS
jgi:diguanylate cyclase (GGDEF)-like protein/PAS domain S-box-containing protein